MQWTQNIFFLFVVLFVQASENSKFFRKKMSVQCALQLCKLHSASTDVDMLQSERDRFLIKKDF